MTLLSCAGWQVREIRSDALFILLVEKDAAFMRLAEDRFYNTYPCIILTAKGQPDVATRYYLMTSKQQQMQHCACVVITHLSVQQLMRRLFLKKLKETLKIPVLALVDSDPYGLKILSVYMNGVHCSTAVTALPSTSMPGKRS